MKIIIPFLAVSLISISVSLGSDTNMMEHMHGRALYGDYSMRREASGTSWQPDATPMEGYHIYAGDWLIMLHGYAFGVYDHQGGPRGDKRFFSPNMIMGMAEHPLGPGTFGLRT